MHISARRDGRVTDRARPHASTTSWFDEMRRVCVPHFPAQLGSTSGRCTHMYMVIQTDSSGGIVVFWDPTDLALLFPARGTCWLAMGGRVMWRVTVVCA